MGNLTKNDSEDANVKGQTIKPHIWTNFPNNSFY